MLRIYSITQNPRGEKRPLKSSNLGVFKYVQVVEFLELTVFFAKLHRLLTASII